MRLSEIPRGRALIEPLLPGDSGTAQTLEVMRQLIDEALHDPVVNRAAIEAVAHVESYDETGEVAALYHAVLQNFRYRKDAAGKEVLRPPRELLQLRAGDCDDLTMLLAALLGSIGYETRAVTIAAHPAVPDQFSHIYLEVQADGRWIPLDAARPGARFGMAPPAAYRTQRWTLTSNGDGVGRLNGVGGVDDIIASVSSGVSSVIRAVQGQSQYVYDPTMTLQPRTTSLLPAQPASSSSSNTILLIGLAVGAFFLLRR